MQSSRALIAVAVAATVAVAAAFVVWLQSQEDDPAGAAPTSSASSSAGPTGPVSTSASGVVLVGQPGDGFVTAPPEVGAPALDLEHFTSPTGNIGCFVTTQQAECEVGDHDFALPAEPADCEFDWVAGFEVSADPSSPPTAGACQSDTALGAADQLAYGETTVIGDLACLSQETGMTCWNQVTGHGFTLSRAAYALF